MQSASQPLSASGTIPDLSDEPQPDLLPDLLDDASAPTELPESGSPWQSEAAVASAPITTDLLDLAVAPAHASSPEPASAPAPLEAQPVFAEAHPQTPAACQPATPAAAIESAAQGLAANASQTLPEAALPEIALPESLQPQTWQPEPELLPTRLYSGMTLDPMPLANVAPEAEAAPMLMDAAPQQVTAPVVEKPQEPAQLQPEQPIAEISSPPGVSSRLYEAERIHHAVELVFDRFRPLLVAAIVRELARHD